MNSLSTKADLFQRMGEPKSADAVNSVDRFITWRDKQTPNDFIQIEYRGSLKSKDIASQIMETTGEKFAQSALTQNVWVKSLRNELEEHLRDLGILPEKTQAAKAEAAKGGEDNPKTHDATKRRDMLDKKRLKDLEEENIQLKARIAKLEDVVQIKKNLYADLAEMGAEFG